MAEAEPRSIREARAFFAALVLPIHSCHLIWSSIDSTNFPWRNFISSSGDIDLALGADPSPG